MTIGPVLGRAPLRPVGRWRVALIAGSLAIVSGVQADEPDRASGETDKPKVHKLYRCQDSNGKVLFSDKPCGPRAVTRDLRVRPAAPTLGERCLADQDQEACEQINRLRRENPEAAMAEIRAGQEAARRKYERQRDLENRIQECINNNERFEFQTRRQIDGRRRAEIHAQCRANPD